MESAGLGERIDFVSADTYGIEGGATAMAVLMDRPTLPTAVVAEYDELAIGALRTLRRASIAVPGRMSVVGVDDHEMASIVDLTTVAQPVQEQGAVAARLLLETLTDPSVRAGRGGAADPAGRPRQHGAPGPAPSDRCLLGLEHRRSAASRPGRLPRQVVEPVA